MSLPPAARSAQDEGREPDVGERPCPNCSHVASEAFCSACGQRTDVDPKSLGAWLAEVFDDTLSLSGRLPKTLWTLMARPGRLTADWRDGRRVRWIPPFRLYLLCSLLFFSVTLLETGDAGLDVSLDATEEMNVERIVRSEVMDEGIARNAPTAMFFLVPLYALILKLFFLGTGISLLEHGVQALHLHARTFLLLVPILAVQAVTSEEVVLGLVQVPLVLAIAASPFLAVWRGYRTHLLWGSLRLLPTLPIYGFLVLIGLLIGSDFETRPTEQLIEVHALYWEMVDTAASGDTVRAEAMLPTVILRYERLEAHLLRLPHNRSHLADAILRRGDAADALLLAQEVLLRDSTYLPALGIAARAHDPLGDTESARQAWDRFLAEYRNASGLVDEYGRHAEQIESMAEEAEPSDGGPRD